MLKENLDIVEKNIIEACKRSERKREEVTLIAVSKTKPIEALQEAYDLGVRVFGENKVQELNEKIPALPEDINWHMIGHLQRNKVKYIVDKVSLIHSVDSLRLAEQISEEAEKCGVTCNILLQVNVSSEATKFGVENEEIFNFVENVSKLKNIKVNGLMTIAPATSSAENNRKYFKKLKELSVEINNKDYDNVSMTHLSMGMTGDYEVAVEEGATLVRVGTGIFGSRTYSAS